MSGCPDSDGDGLSDINDPCPQKAGLNGEACPDSCLLYTSPSPRDY